MSASSDRLLCYMKQNHSAIAAFGRISPTFVINSVFFTHRGEVHGHSALQVLLGMDFAAIYLGMLNMM